MSKELGLLIKIIKDEIAWWQVLLANCNGQDAVDCAKRRIEKLTWALNDIGVYL